MPNDFGQQTSVDNLLTALKGPKGTEVIYNDGVADRWEEVVSEDGTVFKVPKGFNDEQVKTYIKAQQVAAKSQQALGPEPNSPLNPKQEGPMSAVQGAMDMLVPQMPQMPSGPMDAAGRAAMGAVRGTVGQTPVGQAIAHAPDAYEMITRMLSSIKDSRNSPMTRASEGLGYGMAAAIPGVGPGAAGSAETIAETTAGGEPMRASGQSIAAILPLLLSGLAKKPQGVSAAQEAKAKQYAKDTKIKRQYQDEKLGNTPPSMSDILPGLGQGALGVLALLRGHLESANRLFEKSSKRLTGKGVKVEAAPPPISTIGQGIRESQAAERRANNAPVRAKEGIVRNVSTPSPEPASTAKSGPVKGGKVLGKLEKKETVAAKKAAEKIKAEQKAIKEANKPFRGPRSSLAAPGWERIIRNAKGQFIRAEESA